MLKPTLENLRARLRSFTSRDDWQLAVYAGEPNSDDSRLKRVETLGDDPNATVDLVAYAASVVRTTLVGDLAKLGAALKNSPKAVEYLPPELRSLAEHQAFGDAPGSVIGAPCFDPWQTSTNDQSVRRVIGVLAAWGTLDPGDIVTNADLRYLVEQYATTVASVLRPQRVRSKPWLHIPRILPDIEIVPKGYDAEAPVGSVRVGTSPVSSKVYPKFERIEVLPEQVVRVTGDSKDFESYKTSGERWITFGPGLSISKAGLDSFARAWSREQANVQYVKESV